MTAAGFGVPSAKGTVIFYLIAYVGTTLGAFTVASWVGRKGDECQSVDGWAGLVTAVILSHRPAQRTRAGTSHSDSEKTPRVMKLPSAKEAKE